MTDGTRVSTGQATRPARMGVVIGRVVGLVAVMAVILAAVGLIRQKLLPVLPDQLALVIQATLTALACCGAIALACRYLDGRSLREIGLSRFEPRAFLQGAGIWLVLAAMAVALGPVTGWYSFTFRAPTGSDVGWLALQLCLVFCYEALPEELAFRGYAYTNLRGRLPRWAAVLGQAVCFLAWAFASVALLQLFGAATTWSPTPDRVVLFVTFGITLMLVRLWTGSLWGSIGFHLAYQAVLQLLSADRLPLGFGVGEGTALVLLWLVPVVVGGLLLLTRRQVRATA